MSGGLELDGLDTPRSSKPLFDVSTVEARVLARALGDTGVDSDVLVRGT